MGEYSPAIVAFFLGALPLLLSSQLTGCGGRCATVCEEVDQAYIEHHGSCGVQIEAAPVCDQGNVETRRCEQACLEASECVFVQPDTQAFFTEVPAYNVYFECMVGCADYAS